MAGKRFGGSLLRHRVARRQRHSFRHSRVAGESELSLLKKMSIIFITWHQTVVVVQLNLRIAPILGTEEKAVPFAGMCCL
jgi:hypothetical protein